MLSRTRQRGLSMVELLVALAISSFLVLGITQLYLAGKRNDLFRQSQAANLENSRFAVLILNELISKAGYRRSPEQSLHVAFPATSTALASHCDNFSAGAVVTKLKSASNGETGFCIRYQPAFAGEYTCDGRAVTLANSTPMLPAALSETIYMAIKFIPQRTDLNQGSLNCISATTIKLNSGTVQLMRGIADMRIEFGLGAAVNTAEQHADRKLRDNQPFVAAEIWNKQGVVRAVRYSILLASAANQRDSSESKIYDDWLALADSSATARLGAADQHRIYQQVSSLQTLRNMLP